MFIAWVLKKKYIYIYINLNKIISMKESVSHFIKICFTVVISWMKDSKKNKKTFQLRWDLFVTFTIIQSITSSEMCSLHLTHPSAHTHTWSSGQPTLRHPGSSRGFGALLKGLTSVVDNSSRSRDSNPQPQVTSPTLYPLGHDWIQCQIHVLNGLSSHPGGRW